MRSNPSVKGGNSKFYTVQGEAIFGIELESIKKLAKNAPDHVKGTLASGVGGQLQGNEDIRGQGS